MNLHYVFLSPARHCTCCPEKKPRRKITQHPERTTCNAAFIRNVSCLFCKLIQRQLNKEKGLLHLLCVSCTYQGFKPLQKVQTQVGLQHGRPIIQRQNIDVELLRIHHIWLKTIIRIPAATCLSVVKKNHGIHRTNTEITHARTHARTHAHTQTQVCECACTQAYAITHTHTHTHARARKHTHTCARARVHTHTHTHTVKNS